MIEARTKSVSKQTHVGIVLVTLQDDSSWHFVLVKINKHALMHAYEHVLYHYMVLHVLYSIYSLLLEVKKHMQQSIIYTVVPQAFWPVEKL